MLYNNLERYIIKTFIFSKKMSKLKIKKKKKIFKNESQYYLLTGISLIHSCITIQLHTCS